MLGITDYVTVVITVFAFLLVRGPGHWALMAATHEGNIWRRLAVPLWLIPGVEVLMCLAVASVDLLLAAPPEALQAGQSLGAAILVGLVGQRLLAERGGAQVRNMKPRDVAKQTLMITLRHPKATLFYTALCSLLIGAVRQQALVMSALMASTFAGLTFFCSLAPSVLTHLLSEKVRANPAHSRVPEKVVGLFSIGCGFKLAASRSSSQLCFT